MSRAFTGAGSSLETGTKGREFVIFTYLAFTHAAVYDAVVGIHPRYEPYRRHAPAARHASATAAAAAAGHKVLETCSPYAQGALDDALAASLATVPDGAAETAGVAYGERVAQDLIDRREYDGRYAPVQYTRAPAPGVWRPTPPANAPMAVPWLGGVTPLFARSAAQFAPPSPPALTSPRYTRDFAEAKALGSAASTARTQARSDAALFFSGNAAVRVNAALRDQAAVRGMDIVDAARMFAAVAMTVLDALIVTWQSKLDRAYWRPITAIQLADTDGTRHYDSGTALRGDVVDARIWLGIHFRTADTAARTLGIDLADWAARHYFRPTGRHG